MFERWSPRYGNLDNIASNTRGRCHLCHEPADLDCYGRTGLFGHDTVNVDHLDPQAFGGDDDPANLRIAHGTCNSFRGVDDPEDARLVLANTTDEPMSEAAYDLLSAGGSIAVGVIAGRAFAKTNAQGDEEFNGGAALLFGLGTFLLTRAYY